MYANCFIILIGEKLQYILGTLPGVTGPGATVDDVLAANKSVRNMIDAISQNQLLYKNKMQSVLASSEMQGPTFLFSINVK